MFLYIFFRDRNSVKIFFRNILCFDFYILKRGKDAEDKWRGFSIYTLSDLGDLSNLIGSLSQTIQQYSPPSEWIMCELGVFPTFFKEWSFKSRQNHPWQNHRISVINHQSYMLPRNVEVPKNSFKIRTCINKIYNSYSYIIILLYFKNNSINI